MKTSHSTPENSIASDHFITGPYQESTSISNATSYWRCSSCGRESTHEQDLYRATFHAPNCEVHEC